VLNFKNQCVHVFKVPPREPLQKFFGKKTLTQNNVFSHHFYYGYIIVQAKVIVGLVYLQLNTSKQYTTRILHGP